MKYNDYELIYMIKEDEEALEVLIKKYEPLFLKLSYSFFRKYKNCDLDKDDIMQYLKITLCRAVDKYDPGEDILFYTYLLACLRKVLYSLSRRQQAMPECFNYMMIENYENLDEFVSDSFVGDDYSDYEFNSSVVQFKHSLPPLEAQVFELRYNGFSYKEIASLLEINTKKVDNVLIKIRKNLENYFLFS